MRNLSNWKVLSIKLRAQSQQKDTRKRCEICSKLTIKTPEQRQ